MGEREESKSVMCNKSRLILYFVENNGTGDQKVQVNQNNMTICVHKHNQKMTRNFDSFHTPCTFPCCQMFWRGLILEDINNICARGDRGDHSPPKLAAKSQPQPRKYRKQRAGCGTRNSNCGECPAPRPVWRHERDILAAETKVSWVYCFHTSNSKRNNSLKDSIYSLVVVLHAFTI